MINQTFYAELNKKVQTYGLIFYFNKYTKNYSGLMTPQNKLKFTVQEDMLREGVSLQLQSLISKKAKIGKSSDSIRNFAILTLKKNNKVGQKNTNVLRNS